VGLIAVTVAVFGQTLDFDLLGWDDNYNISQNPGLNPPSWRGVISFWQAPFLGLYAPLSYTFFVLEAAIGRLIGVAGNAAWVFHAGNLLLHGACVALVYSLVGRMVNHRPAAWLAAAFFAVHPLQVESVSWVTESRGLLSALFALAALWSYVVSVQRPNPIARRRLSLAACCALLGMALLCKPSAVCLPLMLLVAGIWFDDKARRLGWLVGVTSLLSLAFLVLTRHLQPAELIPDAAPLYARPILALDAIAFYLFKVMWPVGLAPDYGWRPSALASQWWFYALWIVPLACGFALCCWRRDRYLVLGMALFVAALAPTLGLVPFGFQEVSTVADRYAYLALLGVAIAIARGLQARWCFSLGMAASVILLLLAAVSFQQARHWRNDQELYARMQAINTRSFVASTNLGVRAAQAGNFEQAIRFYNEALRLNPRYAIAWYDLGSTWLRLHDYAAARAALEKARALAPTRIETLTNLGRVLLELNEPRQALEVLTEAARLAPDWPLVHINLGDAYLRADRLMDAEACFRLALQAQPHAEQASYLLAELWRRQGKLRQAELLLEATLRAHPNSSAVAYALGEIATLQENWALAERHFANALHLNPRLPQARYQIAHARLEQGQIDTATSDFKSLLAEYPTYLDPYLGLSDAMLRRGDPQAAIAYLREALTRRPGWPSARRRLAWIYAASADDRVRKASEAVAIAEELAGSGKPSPELIDLRGAALAATGRYTEAARDAIQAAELAQARGQVELARRIRQRAALYRQGQPYREAAARIAARPR
jgi:tetratricopeptide (TPR) repeat protein